MSLSLGSWASFGSKLLPAIILVVIGTPQATAQQAADLATFLETHRCEVVRRLEQVHNTKRPTGKPHSKNRYLILSPAASRDRYVQCIFIENDARMLCEAASGAFATHLGENAALILPPAEALALQELGFVSSSQHRNLRRFVATGVPKDLIAVADLMLTALYKGYNLRPDSQLELDAPLAPFPLTAKSRCSPLS